MASQIAKRQESVRAIIEALRNVSLPGMSFASLLQLLCLAIPRQDIIRAHEIDLEGRCLQHVFLKEKDLSDVSFRNSDLSNACFAACNLQRARFEGAILSGTRFDRLSKEALTSARFGNFERFESIYSDAQRIDHLQDVVQWAQRATGSVEKIQGPCLAALQLRCLFLKYVYPDGKGRCDELSENALCRGKRLPGAPKPEECLKAAITHGYLQKPDWRGRVKRVSGDVYNDIVSFVRDWSIVPGMRTLLNRICESSGCNHVPDIRTAGT
jgi:hypothetical protein